MFYSQFLLANNSTRDKMDKKNDIRMLSQQ